jgi:hypothetical protein
MITTLLEFHAALVEVIAAAERAERLKASLGQIALIMEQIERESLPAGSDFGNSTVAKLAADALKIFKESLRETA